MTASLLSLKQLEENYLQTGEYEESKKVSEVIARYLCRPPGGSSRPENAAQRPEDIVTARSFWECVAEEDEKLEAFTVKAARDFTCATNMSLLRSKVIEITSNYPFRVGGLNEEETSLRCRIISVCLGHAPPFPFDPMLSSQKSRLLLPFPPSSSHKNRVVHLDMKPANLLLPLPCQQHGDDEREGWGKQGESKVFLADFGVSRPAGTWLSVAVGTDSFMAPELRHLDDTDEEGEEEEGVEACEKLDMWSFGRTLKSMLEGVKAGRAGAGAEERALWKLVEMCCAYSPEDRPSAK
ncbi:Protein kinase domain-containing protein [Balamuthia mandrillaris]